MAEPPPRSTNRLPAPRTIRKLPSSKPDSPATQTPASPGTSRKPQASPAASPPHRNKIPLPWPSELSPPGHTSPSKRRRKAPAHPLSARARSSPLTLRPGPPHFPTQPAHLPQSAPALPAKHCCCFESERPPAPPRPAQPHPPSTRSPRAASSRISAPPPRLAPPGPVPRSPSASPTSVESAPQRLRSPAAQCFAPLAPLVRIAPPLPRVAYARSSPPCLLRQAPPRPS